MRSYSFIIILFSCFSLISFSQHFWLRIAQTTYTDREMLKSGWDEIEGNKITEIKVQLRYKF